MTAAVQGKWNITIKTPMGEKAGVLELQVEGNTLTGSLSMPITTSDQRRYDRRQPPQLVGKNHQAHALEFQIHGSRRRESHQRRCPPHAGERDL